MAIPIFRGRVDEDGRLTLAEGEREQRRAWLDTLRGRDVEVTVRKLRLRRSIDQNAYWHAVPFPLLAEYFGDSIEGVKFDLLGECFGWTTTKAGHRIPVKPHTSDLTTEEGAHFTDWMVQFAAQLPGGGVQIPLPNEAAA